MTTDKRDFRETGRGNMGVEPSEDRVWLQTLTDQRWLLTSKCPSGSRLFICPQIYLFFSACRPQTSWTQRSTMWTITYLITNPSEGCPPANHASLNNYYKTSHCLPQVGTLGFEGINPLCPPLPGKATKLSFSTSSIPKI